MNNFLDKMPFAGSISVCLKAPPKLGLEIDFNIKLPSLAFLKAQAKVDLGSCEYNRCAGTPRMYGTYSAAVRNGFLSSLEQKGFFESKLSGTKIEFEPESQLFFSQSPDLLKQRYGMEIETAHLLSGSSLA